MSTYFEARTEYPALELFVRIYYSVYAEEFGGLWGTLRTFLERESDGVGPSLLPEVNRVLGYGPTEDQLEGFFRNHIQSSFNPAAFGYTWSDWLTEVRRVALEEQERSSM